MSAQLATLDRNTSLTEHRQSNGMLNPQNIAEAIEIANVMSKSNIVPKDYQGNPGNIVVAIQWGMELGLPPLQAMQNLAVINGRPSLWGDAVIALVRGSGKLEYMREDVTDEQATCTVKRKGEPETARSFSKEDAKRAGLLNKQGPWAQYPKRMMQMRARSWALRDLFPDVIKGIAIAEEAQDMPPERDMGTAHIVTEPEPASRTESVKSKLRGKTKPAAQAEPSVSLDAVLAAIAAAPDLDALKAAGEQAKPLQGADREAALAAYKARQAELKPQPAAEPSATDEKAAQVESSLIEAAKTATTEDERAEIIDAARELSAEARERITAAFPAA
jgi:hypothetical protein